MQKNVIIGGIIVILAFLIYNFTCGSCAAQSKKSCTRIEKTKSCCSTTEKEACDDHHESKDCCKTDEKPMENMDHMNNHPMEEKH